MVKPPMPRPSKICNLQRLLAVRQEARQHGQTIVHCHGCFDIVHPGHIQYLRQAKTYGDLLVVSVSDDGQVNKGINRPLIPQDLRAESLAALECVDFVYVNTDPTAVELLRQLQPDFYIKGREYEHNRDPRFLAERRVVQENGGRVICTSGDVIFSSTALINQLENSDFLQQEKIRRLRDRHGLTTAHLHNLVDRFAQQRVVVVGDYIQDRYHFCEAVGLAGEAPMMSLRTLGSQTYDGGAAVIALHVAGLQAQATLISAMDDAASARLQTCGIDVQPITRTAPTVTKTRFLVDQSKVMKVDEGQSDPIDSQTEIELADHILQAADGASAVIFADFGYGLITAGLLDRVLPTLRCSVPIITADVSGRQTNLLRFHDADLLCPTEREVRETLHDFSSSLPATVWNLLHATQSRGALVTLGKQGLMSFERSAAQLDGRLASEYLPALAAHAIDTLGCGDALLATATLTLTAGGSLTAAAFLGSLAAAVHVQTMGNLPLSVDRILDRLQSMEPRTAVRLAS
jgi:rfaE bifunctional protein kinase chain/domain/rfaE bifunctional protein nucleotidyltransferase chain/domain